MPTHFPIPELLRWQPLRSGLLNLYRYDREEFWFEKGRLLIRGNNGTGKSRVLALQFPFLLDGEISPRRVEPDADPAKRMEWNVLTDKYDNRTGYTWLEFGRVSPDGETEYRTIGCGLHATRGKGAPTRWFFVTRQRVGESLFLETNAQVPLTRQQLQEALGEQGTVFTTARDYRRAVNEALYQLDQERYDALIELLIQLRQPQLSRQLDEGKLSDALSYSLPPLDESVIHAVAESFRQLEEERVALENDQRAVDSVARFLHIYSRYAERQVAEQVAKLLAGQSHYEKALRARNQAKEALTQAETDHQTARAELEACEQTLTTLETERDTLLSRPELQDATRLTRARDEARKAQRGAEAAEADLRQAREILDIRRAAFTDAQRQVEQAQTRCDQSRQQAGQAGTDLITPREWDAWDAGDMTAESLAKVLQAWIRDRREAVAVLEKLSRELSQAIQQEIQAQKIANLQRERWERAEEAATRALADQTRRVEEHLEALAQWLTALRVLSFSDAEALENAEALWCETLDGPPPLTAHRQKAESVARERLATREAQLRQAADTLAREMAEMRTERDTLARGVDPEPAPPRFREPEARKDQPGAPLWRLLDFVPSLSDAERSGVEAAMEASGLLDAWLDPDGNLREDSSGDLLLDLNALSPVSGPALSDFLQPDPAAAGVRPDLLQALLAGIGAAPENGSVWITPTGRWHQGALTGNARKDHAEYIGASARAAARQRRMEILNQKLAEAAETEQELNRKLAAVDEHRKTLEAELTAAPDPARVQEAARIVRTARENAEAEQNERVACDHKALAAREEVGRQREALQVTGKDLRLGPWMDQLDRLPSALQTAQDALQLWLRAREQTEHARDNLARTETEQTRAEADAARTEARTRNAREAALRLKTEADTLDAQVGKGIREIQQQLEQTKQRLETAQSARKTLDEAERKQDRARYQCATDLEQKEANLLRDTETRDTLRDTFLEMTATGILAEIENAPAPEQDPETLSLTALIDWTRALAKHLPEPYQDPDAMDRLQRELYQAIQALTGDLSARNLNPVNEPRHGLNLVFCEYQGKPRGMRELHVILQEETLHRQNILKAKEKEFIERYLIDDIGDRLHNMILNAEELIRNMNAEMESRPMSTGLKLRLVWEPAANAPEGFREARKRLQRSKALLTAEDRRQLGDFLQERITREKEENEGGTWREHLARAVDYRRWHRFGVERHQGGGWQKLTRRTHGTGSGGEKAVALTFPQFAAAAAHYHNLPHAPRLIFLDEAFVGIDSDMRGKCMGLLEHFDLDFVMTSEREWGCYASIRGLAICQLAAMHGTDVVAISRWIWNGHARESAPTPEPARPQADEPTEPENDLFADPR